MGQSISIERLLDIAPQPKTRFEPVKLRAVPNWYVRVAFANGEQTYLSGFETEVAAREWIERHATPWLTAYKNGRYLSGASWRNSPGPLG
jgi:hypothetical protein